MPIIGQNYSVNDSQHRLFDQDLYSCFWYDDIVRFDDHFNTPEQIDQVIIMTDLLPGNEEIKICGSTSLRLDRNCKYIQVTGTFELFSR